MFGAGLPVCARSFAALPEPGSQAASGVEARLVRHGENGLAFQSSQVPLEGLAKRRGLARSWLRACHMLLGLPPTTSRSSSLELDSGRPFSEST